MQEERSKRRYDGNIRMKSKRRKKVSWCVGGKEVEI